jgi:hypothetical protein
MARSAMTLTMAGAIGLSLAACSGGTVSPDPSPTATATVTVAPRPTGSTTPTPAQTPAGLASVAAVKAALVTAADITGSTADAPPTSGTLVDMINLSLVATPCLVTSGIITADRSTVATDVQQPSTQASALEVTEAVIIEKTPVDAATDIGQATAGARACPVKQEDPTGKFGDLQCTTSTVSVGDWRGTRTSALDVFASGVTRVASYVYFLSPSDGRFVVQLGIGFANSVPSATFAKEADTLAGTLARRLDAVL